MTSDDAIEAQEQLYDDEPLQTQDLKMDYILKNTQKKMSMEEKTNYIIKNVKEGKIIVFEGGLDPKDESSLIQLAMQQIDHETFFGIKLYTPSASRHSAGFFRMDSKVTIITPSYVEMYCKAI